MLTYEHNGAALAYDDSAQPDRPTLLFLHGLSSARTTWRMVAAPFADSHRIVTLDQRGHGDSSRASGTYTLDHYVGDTLAFCDDVIGGPCTVVGHSLGGVLAFCIARARPRMVKAVLLEDPPLFRGDGETPPAGVAAFFPMLRQVLADVQSGEAPVDGLVAMLHSIPAMNGAGTLADVLGPDAARAQAQAWASVDPDVFTPAIDNSLLAGAEPDSTVDCPTVVLRADPARGAAFTPEDEPRYLAANPHAQVLQIDGASHIIHDEQPARFVDELAKLL
jgi:pimeloyl-ACP methyl ester carboxylesterase